MAYVWGEVAGKERVDPLRATCVIRYPLTTTVATESDTKRPIHLAMQFFNGLIRAKAKVSQ